MTKAFDLLTVIEINLGTIRTAAGFATEAGRSVLLGPIPKQAGEDYPFIRLHEIAGAPEQHQPNRPLAKMRVDFLAEGYAKQPVASQIVATGHLLLGDLKKALFGDAMRDLDGHAIDAQLVGYSIEPQQDGSDVVLVQVRGAFTFTDHFNNP